MFCTRLQVAHIDGKRWRLTRPLVWEGRWEYFVIAEGFETDFASIPKPVRWLLDNSGRNSEAAVLHDAVWRESKRKVDARVDPWHADGMFRRSLRETGSTTLSRGLMWFAVRLAATVSRRFGKEGPSLPVKVLQLLGIFLLGCLTALMPTLIATAGLVVFWVASWLVAVVWWLFERYRLGEATNWPWPWKAKPVETEPPAKDLLTIIKKPETDDDTTSTGARLKALLGKDKEPSAAEIDAVIGV